MNNFILERYIENLSVCDDLIDFHKKSPNKTPGTQIGPDGKPSLNNDKISTDVALIPNELGERYVKELQNIVDMYVNIYSYSASRSRWSICEGVTIQHYNPTEGFLSYHCERSSNNVPETYRHLVFMTYLNDVDDDGETEFFYQNIKVKPKKGKTLIWPADWTHTHRGITSPTQEKYIITGWFSYF